MAYAGACWGGGFMDRNHPPPNLLFVVYLINEKLFYDFVVVSCIGHTLITRYYLPNEFETTLERKNAPYRRRQKFDSQIAL